MKEALKNFGLGLVYFFLLPVFLVIVAVAGVFALFVIIVLSIKGLVRFFKGDKFFAPLSEDIRVQEIKDYRESLQVPQPQEKPAPAENHVYIQQNYYPNSQPQVPPQQQNMGQPMPNPMPQANPTPIQGQTAPQQIQEQPKIEPKYIDVTSNDNVTPSFNDYHNDDDEEIPHSDKPSTNIDLSDFDQGGDDL